MAKINFFNEDVDFNLPRPRKTATWIAEVIKKEKKELKELNYIFCSDTHLLNINQHYLNHNTLTDVVTFDNSEMPGLIEGDIFISIERIIENAKKFQVEFIDEINRVMIHGALHLCGYSDKSPRSKILMRKKEDAYLSLRQKK
jgi:probable rRNA maturation factor